MVCRTCVSILLCVLDGVLSTMVFRFYFSHAYIHILSLCHFIFFLVFGLSHLWVRCSSYFPRRIALLILWATGQTENRWYCKKRKISTYCVGNTVCLDSHFFRICWIYFRDSELFVCLIHRFFHRCHCLVCIHTYSWFTLFSYFRYKAFILFAFMPKYIPLTLINIMAQKSCISTHFCRFASCQLSVTSLVHTYTHTQTSIPAQNMNRSFSSGIDKTHTSTYYIPSCEVYHF